jgi:hypothetical protein
MSVSAAATSDHLSPLVAGQLRLAENVPLAFARSRPSPVRVGSGRGRVAPTVPRTIWRFLPRNQIINARAFFATMRRFERGVGRLLDVFERRIGPY